jgi:serine/threonine-protein kinase
MATPEKIGKYQIVSKLGQGAMGEVFRAHDPVLNRDVAVKRISAGLDADEMVRKRFQREAQAVANLSHPHIITVYELGFEGDQAFMAMELLEGKDLKHVIANRKLSLGEKLSVMEQMAEGLAFAHASDIVHRDLKPANIHLLPGDKVKIMDFGLARTAGSDMTSTGTVMGTPHYMSPEQVRGQKADTRSDVFALGCICYELLTGKKPFDAESMHGVLFKVMQEEPPHIVEVAPNVPPVLTQLVERALAKDPAERPQSAGEMLTALRQARLALASGRGHEAAERGPSASTLGGPSARGASRTGGSAGGSRVMRTPVPPPRQASGTRTLLVAGGVVLVLLVAGGFLASRYLGGGAPAAAPSQPPAAVQSLAQALIDSQVELAKRRLISGDYTEAARKATDALKLDPQSQPAREVLDAANKALKQVDVALGAVQAAGTDKEKLATAAYELMSVDPGRPEAARAANAAGSAFRGRVDEARNVARQERQKAEQAGADRSSAFAQGADLEKQGDRALESGQLATAARRFLEARGRFAEASAAR